jgi:hypothetical protein
VPCPPATHGKHKRRINFLLTRPATAMARNSKVLREHLDNHGYLTPNFADSEMADTQTHRIPVGQRPNAIRHCWNLERFARALAVASRRFKGKRVPVRIDGPSRTVLHNHAIGGAVDSQHIHGDASDHFVQQVVGWQHATGLSRDQIIHVAARYFTAIGNEASNTLHFDSRPGKPGTVFFVHWAGEKR